MTPKNNQASKGSPPDSTIPAYLKFTSQGLLLSLWVQPGARKTTWAGVHGDHLKLMIQSPPVEGAANRACLAFLCRWFGLRKSDISMIKGDKSRLKIFLIRRLDLEKGLTLIRGINRDPSG